MAPYNQFKIQYSPVTTYPGTTQNNYVGAQTVAGQRGSLPTFNNSNSYFLAKSGNDANAGTAASPKLTLGSLFATTSSVTTDTSGNGNTLTQNGTVPNAQWPFVPIDVAGGQAIAVIPQTGTNVVGNFSDANYFVVPSGVYSNMSGASGINSTIEGFVRCTAGNGGTQYLVSSQIGGGNGVFRVVITVNGYLHFTVNNGGTDVNTGISIADGIERYFACVLTTGSPNSTIALWLGTSPETAIVVATATLATYTPGTITAMYIGRLTSATGGSASTCYLSRVAFSNVARTVFPSFSNSASLLGLYTFATMPLMQSAPKSYIVYTDSGTYNEPLYCNFRYDITSAFGIYAADGQTPIIQYQKGALPGTYGVNNSARPTPGAANYYVAKTGSDSNPGTSGSPFLTVTKALTVVTAGQVIQVADSGTYIADYTLPNFAVTIQAAARQSPVLQAVGQGTSSVMFAAAGASTAATVNGFLINGQGSLGALCGSAAAAFTFSDCTIRNFYYLETATSSLNCTFIRTFLSLVKFLNSITGTANPNNTFNACLYVNASQNLTGIGSSITNTIGGGTLTINNSTFQNFLFYSPGSGQIGNWSMRGSVFNNCAAFFFGGAVSAYLIDNVLFNSGFTFDTITSTVFVFASNNICMGYNTSNILGTSLIGQSAIRLAKTSGQINLVGLNCVFVGYAKNFDGNNMTGSSVVLTNCTSIGASTAGYAAGSLTTTLILNSSVDSGSASAYTGTPTLTNFESSADLISTSAGIENAGLLPSDPFFFSGPTQQTDGGYDWALWYVNLGVALTVNGLTFSTAPYLSLNGTTTANQESGIFCVSTAALKVNYCSFLELGPYGLNVPGSSVVQYNLFNTNGTAVKTNQVNVTIENNAGWECGGAFIANFGAGTTIENNSSWGCAYGQYDSAWASNAALISNIYAGSSVYDYSGYSTQTYADIGTLDPNTNASLDTNSTRLDPLFCNTLTGDLRLQTLSTGFYFDSPAKGKGPAGADMGAFGFTYGAASTSYTTIDFNSTDAVGPVLGTYRNPDTIVRQNLAIHLSEGDQENGAPYSVDSTQKLELVMAWGGANDMPTAQVAALLAMFNASTNVIRVDLGGLPGVPTGYRNAYFVRQHGFEFTEITGMGLSDTGVPTPVKEIVLRLA